ncbi:hypothetical protein CLAFUW4_03918 [Fulvia fulva]|uniref:Uncharacterized protein n=1 Tax=Passalora fulva TaxID=5499 RepID=A0A9Q8LBK3_PASFU|nr:uncharacterized protein CLAFUR5_03887 [Fulvia fulva]KAK4631272.1 hypothetical protein CLAFUR4_03906 [Fulvia fulva]KAK4633858.1 hypothetical protein CLAFUR0_03905 [Fulvia fulva]UJO14397.1 hypothetical protein CLAFUR5_03887 [Fulvia fulva]WPV11927.1 hypothetical protein CLAFUW4_03918 [Fulvia fulva]WPV25614.1 hypothetical protein CLAFUW7_03909 [Fulvia fulva]
MLATRVSSGNGELLRCRSGYFDPLSSNGLSTENQSRHALIAGSAHCRSSPTRSDTTFRMSKYHPFATLHMDNEGPAFDALQQAPDHFRQDGGAAVYYRSLFRSTPPTLIESRRTWQI